MFWNRTPAPAERWPSSPSPSCPPRPDGTMDGDDYAERSDGAVFAHGPTPPPGPRTERLKRQAAERTERLRLLVWERAPKRDTCDKVLMMQSEPARNMGRHVQARP